MFDSGKLSYRQREVYEFIADYSKRNGEAPTLEEMLSNSGLRSKGSLRPILITLEQQGFIKRHPFKSRGIEIVRWPEVSGSGAEPPTKNLLTRSERKVHSYLAHYLKLHHLSPTYEEIQAHLNVASKSTVKQLIDSLETRGVLRRLPRRHRGIDLIEWPADWSQHDEGEIPLLGQIAAGFPIHSFPQADTLRVPQDMIGSGSHYALKVRGNSMQGDGILDGDYLIIESRMTARNGEIVVALIDDEQATLKRFYLESDRIRLEPSNSDFKPVFIKPPQRLRIQGIVSGVIRKFQNTGEISTVL
jgi:repressor LexA